ncbi:General transcription factor 3C polypeptide 2 [Bienertia sinuspersici]
MFDYVFENHLKEMDFIHKLCGEGENGGLVDEEIERISSTITFLSEWRCVNYSPRTIRFVSETGCSNGIEANNEIILYLNFQLLKDFALYVGGLVWSLDWCPRTDQETDSGAKCEFIAVAAHPPDSTYHKQGAPLTGRGMVQIWCLLNCRTIEPTQTPVGNIKRRYKKTKAVNKEENKPVRPRGRPRKNAVEKAPATDPEGQITQALVVHLPEKISAVPPADETTMSNHTIEDILTPVSEKERPRINSEKANVQNNADKEKHQKDEKKQNKPRGKARKNAIDETLIEDPEGQFIPALAVRLPEDTLIVPPVNKNVPSEHAPKKGRERKRKAAISGTSQMETTSGIPNSEGISLQNLLIESPESMKNISRTADHLFDTPEVLEEMGKKRTRKSVRATDLECTLAVFRRRSKNKSKVSNNLDAQNNSSTRNEDEGPSLECLKENYLRKDNNVSEGNDVGNNLSDPGSGGSQVLKKDILPRVVLCLGHDGKVAWDVKWRPPNADVASNKHIMGYLAVVLGNGFVEVWEVPSIQVINRIYASQRAEGTDPRFAKLKPVFRCTALKYGSKQSMPLTVEWSAYPPHDLILAGCHDGVVALWKFSVKGPSEDVRPLLCFSAETGPIRSLSWAPYEGDPESSNIFVTAGHGGLKFWDLRDPFRPLWDANPSQRFLYSLDWVNRQSQRWNDEVQFIAKVQQKKDSKCRMLTVCSAATIHQLWLERNALFFRGHAMAVQEAVKAVE